MRRHARTVTPPAWMGLKPGVQVSSFVTTDVAEMRAFPDPRFRAGTLVQPGQRDAGRPDR